MKRLPTSNSESDMLDDSTTGTPSKWHWITQRHPRAVACRIGLYLLAAVLFLLMADGHFLWYRADAAAFAKIQVGMSRWEVLRIMGFPGDQSQGRFWGYEPPSHWHDCSYWLSGSGLFVVWFDDETGKVLAKSAREVWPVWREPIMTRLVELLFPPKIRE